MTVAKTHNETTPNNFFNFLLYAFVKQQEKLIMVEMRELKLL